MEKEIVFQELEKQLQLKKIILNEKQKNQFYEYMMLLLEWNKKINLTAITEPKEIVIKHFIDSLTIIKHIKEEDKIIDIGTGAGFPGIPLKIVNPNLNITLLDSLNKRIIFLNEIIEKLQLKSIETIHGRAEDIAKIDKYREKYNIVTTRAVSNLNVLAEYMLPFNKIGGRSICMKGSEIEEEINKSRNAIKILGGKIKKIENIQLGEDKIQRNIIIIEKEKNTPKKYPRKAGIPNKEPLK